MEEKLALRICAQLKVLQWRSIAEVGRILKARPAAMDRAVRWAVSADWLSVNPGEDLHSVSLAAGWHLHLASAPPRPRPRTASPRTSASRTPRRRA